MGKGGKKILWGEGGKMPSKMALEHNIIVYLSHCLKNVIFRAREMQGIYYKYGICFPMITCTYLASGAWTVFLK